MTNYNLSEEEQYIKRRRVLSAIADNVVNSDEEDDNAAETLNICDIIEDHEHDENGSAAAIRVLGETIRNALLEIHEARERNRDRRHRELLEVLSRLTNNPKQQHSQTDEVHKVQRKQRLTDELVLAELTNESTPSSGVSNVTAEEIETSDNIARVEKTTMSEQDFGSNTNVCKQRPIVATNAARTISNSNMIAASLVMPCRKQGIKLIAAPKGDPVRNTILSRANMLEMQRIKMEDRERKKRELIDMKKL